MATKPQADKAPVTTNRTVLTGAYIPKSTDARIHMVRAFLATVATAAKAEASANKANGRKTPPSPIKTIDYSVPTLDEVRVYVADRIARARAKGEHKPLPAWRQDGPTRASIVRGMWGVKIIPDFRAGEITAEVGAAYKVDAPTVHTPLSVAEHAEILASRPKPGAVIADAISVYVAMATARWPEVGANFKSDDYKATVVVDGSADL